MTTPSEEDMLEELGIPLPTQLITQQIPLANIFGDQTKSTKNRIEGLANKLESIIEKGFAQNMTSSREMNSHALAGFMSNYIKLMELGREIELDDTGGNKIYEIIGTCPEYLKIKFSEVWNEILEHYSAEKGIDKEKIFE